MVVLVVDISEWCALARRLEAVNSTRFAELLQAMRDIVEAEEGLADPRLWLTRIRNLE